MAINDALLAPPTVKDDVGDQLSGRVLGVLYEIWLVACVKCFPSPSLWKTFREMAMNWRHRIGLVDQWNRVSNENPQMQMSIPTLIRGFDKNKVREYS